jgi:ferrochelatase
MNISKPAETTVTGPARAAPGPTATQTGKIGILLVNLGTPDGTGFWPMWRYLREFLSDPRVIELPRILWYPILYGIVLTIRPRRSGKKYESIWDKQRNQSPLHTFSYAQRDRLAEIFAGEPRIAVELGMRYGNPSTKDAVQRLADAGCHRIVMLPLYPQYSATTTATANDKLFRALMKMRRQPSIRSVPAYYDEPVYIDSLARSIEAHLAKLDFEPEVVVASYHGIPKPYAEKGDPYEAQCLATTRLLRGRLGWDEKRLITTFQSRFGAQEWLQPYTDKTVERLAKDGVKRIAIVNPGFSVDCIETLEEIGEEVRDVFLHAGGEKFSHIPCLNASDEGMAVIEALVRREMQGWM